MAKEFYTDIDLKGNKLENATLGAGAPNIETAGFVGIADNGIIIPADTKYKQWLDGKMRAENQSALQAEADSKFTLTQTGDNDKTRYADVSEHESLEVVVTLKFDGVNVDAESTPSGWTKTSTGVYRRTTTDANIASQQFQYKPGGKYGDIVCKKSSAGRTITVSYPIWYGYASTNNAGNASSVITSLTKTYTAINKTSYEFNNNSGGERYLWAVTRGSATITRLADIMNSPVSVTLSVGTGGIELSGYKAYISTNTIIGNQMFDKFIIQ